VILLESALDYAGLFPPAGLGMAEAVRNFAGYRTGKERGLLGAFVVPVARLDELAAAARDLLPAHGEPPWALSVLGGSDPALERKRIADFGAAHPSMTARSVERKVETADEVRDVVAALRGDWSLYLEIPADQNATDDLIAAVAAAGAFAKVRTGGTTAERVPSSEALARFVVACSNAAVPFKATAGLHHAFLGDYRLTYEPSSPCAAMHGFLNLFIGAALLDAGKIGEHELRAVLEERARGAFQLEADGTVRWRDRGARAAEVRRARARLLHSFGTCSFEEPVQELRALGALA